MKDEEKGIIIYGAGHQCRQLINKLGIYQKISIWGVADSYLTGNLHNFKLFNIFEADYQNVPAKIPIVISVGNLQEAFKIAKRLCQNGFENVFWYLGKTKSFLADFFEAECINLSPYIAKKALPSLEVHVADFCNLNCSGCVHFSPLFKKKMPIFEMRVGDLKILSNLIDHVFVLSLLGGEPLVNPDCANYVEAARQSFPNSEIQLITNGLLIPKISDELFCSLHENRITVVVSEYEPTHKIIDKIKDRLEMFHIDYTIRAFDKKQKFNRPLSIKKNSMHDFCCICDGCTGICDGKIARCPALLYIDRFNEVFGQKLPNEGIYNISDFRDGQSLIKKMKERVPLCDYCIRDEIDWHSCGANPQITDFAALD